MIIYSFDFFDDIFSTFLWNVTEITLSSLIYFA